MGNEMNKVGDFKWCQISQWDFAPDECVETFIRSQCGKHVFHYVLKICYAVISDTHTKWEVVKYLDNLPEEILAWRGGVAKERERKLGKINRGEG
jgi:hypothetical protein